MACVGLAAALGACGGGGDGGSSLSTNPGGNPPPGGGTPPPPASTVTLVNQAFSPTTITVTAGTTVTWKWNDCSGDGYGGGTCVVHQVAFDDGSGIKSDSQDQGTFARTFATKGTYKYHCTIHQAQGMVGEVVVQ